MVHYKGVWNVQEEYKGRLLTIAGMINLFPEKHDQATWICGTTYCVGGYAVNLFAEEEFKWDDIHGGALYVPEGSNLAKEFGNYVGSYTYIEQDPKKNDGLRFKHVYGADVPDGVTTWLPVNIHALAASLLGLDHDEAVVLFNGGSSLEQVNSIIKNMLDGQHVAAYEHGNDCDCEYCFESEEYEYDEEHFSDYDYN